MMTNLLHGAHVANKLFSTIARLRLLLVMFVALTVSAEVWGADVTINVASDTWTNTGTSGTGGTTKVSKSGVTISSDKGYKDGTTAIREYSGGNITVSSNDNITKIVFTSTANKGSKYGPDCIALKSGSAGTYTTSSNSSLGTWTGTAKSITFTCSAQFRWKQVVVTTADAHTVTWTINPTEGGILSSTSGTSTTVTPNAAYTYGSPAFTVTPAGKANVSQDGDNFTATPSANCTIQINMVEKTPATISFENMGNPTPTTTGYYVGDTYTLPTTNDYTCGDKTFVGWSTEIIENSATKPTAATYFEPGASVTLAANQTFYAVFAEGSGEETLTSISGGDWSNGVTSNWTTYGTGTYSGNGVKFDGTGDYVISPDLSSKNYTTLLLKFKSGYNGSKGSILTFYAYDSNNTLLTNEQVTIDPETVVPDVSYTAQNTVYEVNISASKIIGKVMIQMTSKTSNLGMKYCEIFGISFSYKNYTTQCITETSYSVAIAENIENGEVTANLTSATAGTEIELTATPDKGYQFSSWIVTKDGGGTVEVTNNKFTMPASNVTVSATFEALPKLTTPTNLSVSNISCSGATLAWNTVAGASKYELCLTNTSTSNTTTSYPTTNSAYLTLASGTTYSWTVQAIGDGITYNNSDITEGEDFTSHYTITYNVDGGSTVEDGCGTTLPVELPTPTRTHYNFAGWYMDEGFNTPAEAGSVINTNITLYAKWEEIKFTITWSINGNTTNSQELQEGTTITPPADPEAATYACEDKVFVGWVGASIDGSTNEEPDFITDFDMVTGDKTYYAVFATPSGDGFTLGQSGDFKIYANVEGNNIYAATYNNGKLTSTNEDVSAVTFKFTHKENNQYTIYNGSNYVAYGTDGTDLKIQSDEYLWTIAPATNNKGSWRVTSVQYPSRAIIYRTGYDFKAYGTNNITTNGYYDIEIGGATTYTEYVTSCVTCENVLTISKGNEENGTFTLDKVGEQETCDGLSVIVTPTPAEHHSVASVTATTPTTGDAPTVTNNGNDTWTVTYNQNSTGESTINVTFVQDAKASITLSELGVPTTDNTTYYVGETYTLPSTSSQSCDGKQLVGWSTEEVAETDTKPTENYYELGAEVTLAATQTFYAVFATEGGVPSTDYNQITSIEDLTDGNYVIAYGYNITSPTIILKAETKDETTLVATSAGPTDNKYTDPAASNIWEIKKTNTTYTLYNAATSKYIQATNTPSLKLADADPTEFQISYSSDHWKIKLNTANTYQLVGYTNASGNYFQTKESPSGSYKIQLYKSTSTVVYTAYTTSCIPTYSITYDFAGGTGSHCSNTSVPQGEKYTICEEEPIKEGHTFQGWSDGTSTYAAGTTITPTKNTTLTAQWQINTYTVTWSNNGVTTLVTYEHGDDLTLPSAPESCDGVKEFVGWTEDNTFTYHATTPPSDIFTEKTATVTADATYYAVFATPPGTGGGGGGSETTTTLDFTAQGYADATAISNLTVDGVTATFAKGSNSNAPKYYTNGTAIRAYGGNTITLSSTGTITSVTFTFSTGDDENEITANNGDGEWNEPDWTGNTTNDIVFTIGGTSGHRRIKSIAVTYTSGGGSGSYSDYTTTCQPVESIEVQNPQTEFYLTDNFTIGEGKVIATLSGGGTADVTALATFSGYNMEVVGTYTVTVTYMGATATYNINVKPLDNAWVLTWNVSGKTNTGLGPRYVTKGTAIGTLPTPVVPDACEGKTFMGWTTSNIVNSDGTGITYINEGTVPTDNTTYYAVFATVNNFCTQKPIDQIAPGSKVVIVAVASLDAGGTTGKAISSRTSDDGNNLAGDEVSIYDNTINTPHSTCIWTLYKDGEQYYFKQGDYFLNAVDEEGYTNLKWNETKELWNITSVPTYLNTYYMESTHVPDTYIEWYIRRLCFKTYYDIENENGEFDMQFFVTANANGGADITDYTTGCTEYTITYYGFRGGYSTSTSSDGIIVLPVNSMHTVPNCGDVVTDHTNLGREFLNVWMTQPHGGHTFKPGDTFILTQDTTLYAQWKMETTSDVTTLPTDIEDLAGTDVYVYGGKTLNIQPGTTTINSLTLKGGLQSDGSYKMPIVWVPEGATLVRNSNKIYLDLVVNAKNYYPFAVPFATKNDQYLDYLDPVLNAASTYDKHFVIKTYDGALRATNGEDRANNWVKVLRHATDKPSYLQPGVGYIIQALTYPDKDTATIRIPMTVPNTWFENGEQAVVGTTVRNSIAVTAHDGAAADEHLRHAGWNFVASPYLTSFAGGNVANDGGLAYINGELIVNGGWQYGGDPVPYVTIPAYDFSYYTQHKLSDVKLSPEWSFFVQIGTSGKMNFSTAGRQETPASIAARHDAAQSFKMDVDITLSDKNHSDQMGLIISDRFSSAYEVGYDLEKMFGSAYNLTVYTLMEDNTPLAYQALAIHSNMQVIPVGYRVPEQGDYTFALNQSTSSIDLLNEQYEQLILVDYETGALTNLLNSTYTFTSPRTQSDSRFAIYAVIRQKTPTDLPNIDDGDTSTRKILHNGHLYILRDGKVYNGNGQIVK